MRNNSKLYKLTIFKSVQNSKLRTKFGLSSNSFNISKNESP